MASRPWLEDTTTSAKRPWLDESSDIEAPYKGFDEIGTPVKAKQEPTKPTQTTTPPKKDPQAWRYQDIKIPSIREATADAIPQNQNSRDMKLTVPLTPDKERKHPAFNDTNEPWVQASLDRAPEGTRIQNTESPYWHLPEGQQKLVDDVVKGAGDIETKRTIIKKRFGFDYYAQPPYNLHGTAAGMGSALVENMFSRVGTLPPAENANEYAVMGAGLAGSLVPGAMAAGVTAPLGPVAQGAIGGVGANLAATHGNANREEIVKQALLGALAGGFGGYGVSKGAPKPLSTANVDATPTQVSMSRMQPEVSPKMQVQMNRGVSTAKQPWEMTRAEFDKEAVFRGVGPENKSKPNMYWSDDPRTANLYGSGKDKIIRVGYKSEIPKDALWEGDTPVTPEEWFNNPNRELREITLGENFIEQTGGIPVRGEIVGPSKFVQGALTRESIHKSLIEDAIKSGKPIPREVLADYPDLAKKYGVSEIDPTVSKTEPVVSNPRQVPTSAEVSSQPPVASVQGGGVAQRVKEIRPAIRYNGEVYTGKTGQNHADIWEQLPEGFDPNKATDAGWVTQDGTWLNRKQAAQYVLEKKNITKEELSQYGHASGMRRAIDTPPSPVGKVKEPAIPDTPVQAIDDAAIPPTDPPRPKSPTLVPVDDTPDAIGLKKAEIERIRGGLELDRLPQAQRVTMEETLSRANEENTAARADAVAQRVLAGGEMSDTEYAGMTIRAAQLANESDDILSDIIKFQDEGNTVAEQQARLRLEEVTKQMDVLTRASDMAGTEQGRSLNLRKMMVNLEDYSLAKVTNRARERKGSALTEKETARIERVVNERNEIQKQLDEALKRNEELTVKQEEIIAQRVAQAEATRANIRKKAAGSREAIKADRDNIKKQLEAIGYRVNDITGVTTEGAYLIGKLAVSYIREGVTNLAEVVKLVKNDLPDLSDYDIYRAMNTRDPNVQARMASEATKKVESLKRQARILADIEDAEKGIFRPTNKRKPSDAEVSHLKRQLTKLRNAAYSSGIHPDRLEKAIRTINELQDRIEKHYTPLTRRLKPTITSELAAMKEQIADLRKHLRLDDELADLNEQIRTGEFKVPQKKMRRPESPEIARLRMARDRARNKIEAELEILAPMTGKRVLGETVNTLRTLKATADLSATLRQGLVLSVTRPGTAFKAFGQGVKSMFSKHTAEQIDYAIKNRETAYLGDRAGLYLAELADARLTSHEEAFMSRFVEKVPIMGAIVRGSERAMVTQLNILRSAAFDEFIRVNPNATATELKAWANFVNVASGRGDLGRLAGAADYLSTVFFAPRFAASRFQTPYMFLKYAKEPRVRKAIAKDLVGTIGLGATMLTLAGMAGADVSGDPRNPDFGKIKIGPTRIDVWAGFQQPARLIANPTLGWAFAKKANKRRDDSFIEQAMRFASFKLAPTITLPSELLSGRTVIGEKIDRMDALANSVIPMMYEDVFDAYRQQGIGMAALTTGLNLVGVSTNTYQKKK